MTSWITLYWLLGHGGLKSIWLLKSSFYVCKEQKWLIDFKEGQIASLSLKPRVDKDAP